MKIPTFTKNLTFMDDLAEHVGKVEDNKYVVKVFGTLDKWYDGFAKFTPNLIVGIIVFLFFLAFSSFLTKMAVKYLKKFFPEKADTVTSLVGAVRFLILLMGTFISLEIMGLSGFLWKFIGSLGVAGVIAGVALKDLVSSIFSGMLVGIDKSFKVGDYITLGNYSGNVQEIGFLTTKLITDDGRKAYIPNQVIFNAPFFNVTASPQRKIIIDFDIPASEDISLAKETILDAIKSVKGIDKVETSDVLFTSLKQGVFNVQVKFWLELGQSVVIAKSNAYIEIKKALDKAGIGLSSSTSITIENNKENK